MEKKSRFLVLLDEMRQLHDAKNAGYAGQDSPDPFKNFKYSTLFGVAPFTGCLIRMSDKFIRIANLTRDASNDKVGESIRDTLMDMAVYCLIAICLYEEEHPKAEKCNSQSPNDLN